MGRRRKLNPDETLERLRRDLKEYDRPELVKLFKRAIQDQAVKGILTWKQAKDLSNSIEGYLAETLGEIYEN